MKIAIRIEVTTDYGETETFELFKLERPYRDLEPAKIGLSLAEGKHVLHEMQKIVVAAQAEEVCTLRRFCTRCHRMLDLKDRRIRKLDTVFGTVPFRTARIVSCPCETPYQLEYPYNPMTEYIPERASAELLALEAKLSALMPSAGRRNVARISARTGHLEPCDRQKQGAAGRRTRRGCAAFHAHRPEQ